MICESSPFNLSTVAGAEDNMRANTKLKVCGKAGADLDKNGRGGAEYGV